MNKPLDIKYVIQWRTCAESKTGWGDFDTYQHLRDGLSELRGCRQEPTAGEYRLVQRICVEVVVEELEYET